MKEKTKPKIHKIIWTNNAKEKMRYYQVSEQRVRRILKSPQRTEKGIAQGTLASMQRGGRKRIYEIWVMYQDIGDKRKIISVWRYPGQTKPGELIVPDDGNFF